MAAPMLTVGLEAICPHGGRVSVISANTRVRAAGQPIATGHDLSLVEGCPFMIGGTPQPCVRVEWLVPATRVKVTGLPVLVDSTIGLAIGPMEAPQGPVCVLGTQSRVTAS